METKHHTFAFNIKSFEETGAFAGYASVFNVTDSQNDMVMPGAFARTLLEGAPAKLLWQHQPEEPIGVLKTLKEDAIGLYIEGEILLSLTRGREAYALLKSGAINGLSIGYRTKEYAYDPESGIRYLTEVELFEVSLVTFPANELAGVTSLKSGTPTIRDLEHILRDAGFSRKDAKAVAARGFAALHDPRDAASEELIAALENAASILQS